MRAALYPDPPVSEIDDWLDAMDAGGTHPVAYLEGWYVDPDVRRSGLGRRLLHAAERWAGANGFTEMASDAELHNAVSLRAHRALGFDEVERQVCFRKPLV